MKIKLVNVFLYLLNLKKMEITEKPLDFLKFTSSKLLGINVFEKEKILWSPLFKILFAIFIQCLTIYLGYYGIFVMSREFFYQLYLAFDTFNFITFLLHYFIYYFGRKDYRKLIAWVKSLYQPENQKIANELTDVSFSNHSKVLWKFTW